MGYLEIVGAAVIWACTGPLLRLIQKDGFTSWDIVLARSVFSSCLLGLYLLVTTKLLKKRRLKDHSTLNSSEAGDIELEGPDPVILDSRDLVNLILLGFLAVVFAQSTYFYALSQTSVAVAVTLNYTSPFFVMALSFLLYKEPITRGKVVALTGAVVGVALASGFIGSDSVRLGMSVPGVVAGALSGFGYGLQTIVYKQVGRKYGPIPLNFWTMTFGALQLSTILTIINRRPPDIFVKLASAPAATWLLFLLLGIGPGTAAFILFADGINKVDATKGSIVAMAEPVAACLLGYFVLAETLAVTQVVGVGLVLASIWTVSIPEARRRTRKLTTEQPSGTPSADSD